jgi:monofunctional biosynthetic peptidoglycan transglycosylase
MLKFKKILLAFLTILVLYAAYIAVSLAMLPSVDTLENRRMNMTISVKDWKGNEHPFVVGPKNRYWTPSSRIPPEMKWAVILAEDSRFYKHEGIDVKAIKNAIKYDLEKKSFSRGASTITQQVAKNLFLSREKTITRKVEEVYVAKRMEEVLTKGRIIELYLNVVELGPMVYGIGHGARYYFGKPASALNPRECAFLAAMLPGPRIAYNPYKNLNRVLKRSDMILKLMLRKGVLSEGEYRVALAEQPNINGLQRKVEETIQKEPVFTDMTSAFIPAPEIPEAGSGENGQQGEPPPSLSPGEPAPPDGGAAQDGGQPQGQLPAENTQPEEK